MAGFGWARDVANSRLDVEVAGTTTAQITTSNFAIPSGVTLQTVGSLDVDGTSNFAAEAEFAANIHVQSTLEAGSDGVGSDGEQLTSGGAAAECDWASAASVRESKNLFNERTDKEEVLKTLISTPVYDFKYKTKEESEGQRLSSTKDFKTTYTGIVADEAPWAMHYNGRILNPINTFGYTVLAIKALAEKIEALEKKS